MTVREYRRGESNGVAELWQRNPSKEFPVLGLNPMVVGEVLRRTERPMVRFIVGLARLFGRPIFVMFVVDLNGRVMGTTLLSFTREAGYVSGVVVDSTVRRQGHARAMLAACDETCRRYHRPYVVLDVLAQNDPAIQLYDRWGYQPLRDQFWMARPLGSGAPSIPPPSGTTRIRPFQPSDGVPLAAAENALMPPEVRAVVPRHPDEFRPPGVSQSLLESQTSSWVAEVDGRPVGFLAASVSRLMEAGNLSSPVFRGDASETVMQDLLGTALRWAEAQGVPRIVTGIAQHQLPARPVLEAAGFAEEFRIHTMVHRLAA